MIKEQFPIFQHHPRLVYLDSAATTQTPKKVIDRLNRYQAREHANIHRGLYQLSEQATTQFEEVREKVKRFLSASDDYTVVFTHGATESLNIVAHGLEGELKAGDYVAVMLDAHHSHFVPWQELCRKHKAHFVVITIDKEGRVEPKSWHQALAKKPKIVALGHGSNVTGVIHPVARLVREAKKSGALTVVDGTQTVGHCPVSLTEIKCDFLAFSAHKMYGPTGIGVLIGKTDQLKKLTPLMTGGRMVESVDLKESLWTELPYNLEAGTPPIAGVIGLGTAIDWLTAQDRIKIWAEEQKLTAYTLKKLQALPEIKIVGPQTGTDRLGVISFNVGRLHSHDLASLLADDEIATRAGHHCALPLHRDQKIGSSLRASLGVYNTSADIDQLIVSLKKAIAKLS